MSRSAKFGDGSLDNEHREIVRQAFASYSRQERVGIARFINLLIAQPIMREERTLRLMAHCLDERLVKRKAGNLRLVTPLCDEAADKSSF